MQPYDGTGYGASLYWRSQMKDLAANNGEFCPCWSSKEPKIRFEGEDGLKLKVECEDKTCGTTFERTEKDLVNRFRTFYKV